MTFAYHIFSSSKTDFNQLKLLLCAVQTYAAAAKSVMAFGFRNHVASRSNQRNEKQNTARIVYLLYERERQRKCK